MNTQPEEYKKLKKNRIKDRLEFTRSANKFREKLKLEENAELDVLYKRLQSSATRLFEADKKVLNCLKSNKKLLINEKADIGMYTQRWKYLNKQYEHKLRPKVIEENIETIIVRIDDDDWSNATLIFEDK